MTTHTIPATITVEDLLAMNDVSFTQAVTQNLHYAGRFSSPFQQPAVLERTLLALVERLWFTDAQIQKQAEDPTVSLEHYDRTIHFRRHLLSILDVTERRAAHSSLASATKQSQAWKATLHEVCDELEDGPDDDILDAVMIPGRVEMNLRTWLEIRRVKDPSRVKVKEAVAA